MKPTREEMGGNNWIWPQKVTLFFLLCDKINNQTFRKCLFNWRRLIFFFMCSYKNVVVNCKREVLQYLVPSPSSLQLFRTSLYSTDSALILRNIYLVYSYFVNGEHSVMFYNILSNICYWLSTFFFNSMSNVRQSFLM